MSIDLAKVKKAYFIGIGGIGISAIARMMKLEGKEVSGSDRAESKVIAELRQAGIAIFLEQKADNLDPATDLVIYTIAISPDNPEYARAVELGIPLLSYPEALGLVSAGKFTVAVSGTHGKTTTTAMLGKILIEDGLDPTVIVGSLVPEWQSNFRAGASKYFVAEACEYRRSFLNLSPKALIITNIDNDHLDYYQDLADIQSAFAELVSKLPADGFLVCDLSDPALAPVIAAAKCPVIDYAKIDPQEIVLRVPGAHNKKDALAALAVALELGVTKEAALGSLENFPGTWRRFEYKGELENEVKIYDDYAHHPTEIRATLSGARDLAGANKITVVFQPHLYSRTKLLFDEFAAAFQDADQVLILPIYAAREADDGSVTAEDLVQAIKENGVNAIYCLSFAEAEKVLAEELAASQAGDLVITMGAGEAYKIGENMLQTVPVKSSL